ncbi:MAG: exo-alpha-sialidase [Kiritimatiellae bacterium]|nr:exo-alpha-sialidase [Kiritimatiellia bacterium]MDD5521154.1 exo-alpha-sialidase [Kiritimatiellia bacterium]
MKFAHKFSRKTISSNLLYALLFLLIPAFSGAADISPTLHPNAQRLPFKHQGPFITTADGGVLCVNAQNAMHSTDEGKNWTSTPVFRDAKKFNISNERALLRTRDGVVIASWMNGAEKMTPPGWNWGAKDVSWQAFVLPTYVCRSLDDGKTWEEPVKLNTYWCGCIHSMIETRSGRIVLVGQEIIPEWRHATVMFVSDDKGKTWLRSNVLDYGIGRHDHAGSIEGTVVERKDGSLYLLLRTESGYLWEATSHDGGLKWENLKQSPVKSVTCCPQMARLSDNRVALLWNHPPRHQPDSRNSREELFLAFSSDECATWLEQVVVAGNYGPGGRVSYPYLYERRPGELWITTMQGGLRMKISVADLNKGEIPIYKPPVTPPPKPGGIIMFGDSTTALRPGSVEKVYAVRVNEALQSIGASISVHNAGIGGNTTINARSRFAKDVLQYKPRIVVIQFGINDAAVDVWKKPPAKESRVPLATYETNMRSMIADLRKQDCKPILMTTNPVRWTNKLKDMYGKSPYQPDDPDGFDKPVLSLYNETVRKLSRELDVPLVDVHATFAAQNPDKLLLDGMHPNDAGHTIVAELLVPVIRSQLR